MWRGLDENAPVAGTELPGYPPFKRRRILEALMILRHLRSVALLLRAQRSSRHKNCRIGGLMFDNQHT